MTTDNTAQNILLCVSGTTPAIITETYYYLAKLRQPTFIPDRVIIVTTQKGYDAIQKELFDNPRFATMCAANGWNAHSFLCTAEHIHVVKDNQGQPLPDIRTPEHFHSFADTLMQIVKELTSPNRAQRCVIHASLAGGRKTMSYYMGQVMSIFGRPTDSLSHILVHEDFEKIGLNFYYPHQSEALVISARNQPPEPFPHLANTPNILDLSEFPVLPISSTANIGRFLHSNLSFHEILLAARDELNGVINPISFSCGPQKLEVKLGYDQLMLSPKELAYLLWLGWRRQQPNPILDLSYAGKDKTLLQEKAEQIKMAFAELYVCTYFVRYNQEALDLDECPDLENTFSGVADQLSYIRTDLSRLLKKLDHVSHVYDLQVKRPKAPPSPKPPSTYKTTRKVSRPTQSVIAKPTVMVKDDGKYQAPAGLLQAKDYQQLDNYLSCYLPLVLSKISY